jgi:hypothetical protein
MAKKPREKSYWPHMIMGFLIIGISLGYWTVKSATSHPVEESNEYLTKYQQADLHFNEIHQKKARFDKAYTIDLTGVTLAKVPLEHAKRAKFEVSVLLAKGANRFIYVIKQKNGNIVPDANVTFLLTRPHTAKEDQVRTDVPFQDGVYVVNDINITKPGRYILRLKAVIDDNTIGYSQHPAYLMP